MVSYLTTLRSFQLCRERPKPNQYFSTHFPDLVFSPSENPPSSPSRSSSSSTSPPTPLDRCPTTSFLSPSLRSVTTEARRSNFSASTLLKYFAGDGDRLNLTIGIIPSLNVAADLLGFFFVKSWTGFLSKFGFSSKPFTKQENTVIQTCVVSCYGLAYSRGST
ncbi:Oligopeptide transporter OPT superfamily [Arabidopsis suecica]|uniref:Oligopeptide transporter OPT superfamily n=1 Tax=Arabidopsis suecica TaxID=45249 RepID=A0A8T2BN11_ARASU|nr:Oligopeptide transporter OPT superfamily [Arabidopsis suecica]KAG7588788.1 Oligopeptide transporter OPT superfamily [Arabidopsis suecica]